MPLPSPYFWAFEILIFILFSACFRDAWRRGPPAVWHLTAGVAFGLILEWATIQQLEAYSYGSFTVMLGPVPG